MPQYHPKSDTTLAMGHVGFYRGDRFSREDQLPRNPVYAVRRKDGSWSEQKKLEWDDPRGAFIYTNNCGQRMVLPDGDILLAFTVGPTEENREVAGVRVSDDGLHYGEKKAWAFDDGESLALSTTQQHWMSHPDGLYLVYTRKDPANENVMRWRSPLWTTRVDPDHLHLIRETERVVLPLVGDGIESPDEVALMGNFHVTNVTANESWVTVGEWMPRREARGDTLLARVRRGRGK